MIITTPDSRVRYTRLSWLLLWVLSVLAGNLQARTLDVPIRLDVALLEQSLHERLFRGKQNKTRLFDDRSGCNFLEMERPAVSIRDNKVRIFGKAKSRSGQRTGKQCLFSSEWRGFIEVLEKPEVNPNGSGIRFRIVDSFLYEPNMTRGFRSGVIWDSIKRHAHPQLRDINIDFIGAIKELKILLPLFMATDQAQTKKLLDSIRLDSTHVEGNAVVAILKMDLAENSPPPVARRNGEETNWDEVWDGWDAFLTNIVKASAMTAKTQGLRRDFRDVLLNSRYAIAEAMATSEDRGSDPVRELFITTWEELAPLFRRLSNELSQTKSLKYISFITAADALEAIDSLGPASGLEISTDGLRRLARMVTPQGGGDPLEYKLDIDQELRNLFDLGPPIPEPPPQGSPQPAPQSSLQMLVPVSQAAYNSRRLLEVRLNRWVPSADDIQVYLPLVRKLLIDKTRRTLKKHPLDPRYEFLFKPMVLATAWQETCWQHFIERGGEISVIRSNKGAVGMMQIMPRVWRGLYNTDALKSDVGYNIRAGTEILMHYLTEYAIARGEDKRTKNSENLARATYAAYNGGPRHLTRYRKKSTGKSLRRIDASFWKKYQIAKAGRELQVRRCFRW